MIINKRLKQRRQVTTTKAIESSSKAIPISLGGLGTKSIEGAIKILNTIKSSDLGEDGGIPVTNAQNKVKLEDLYGSDLVQAEISGNSTVHYNTTYEYKISNFDSFSTYDVTVSVGDVKVEGDTIYYVAPSEGYTESDTVLMHVNGFPTTLKIATKYVGKANIVGLSNDDIVGKDNTISFNSYNIVNGYAIYDPHASTDIQIAKDYKFENIVHNHVKSTIWKNSFTITLLDPDQVYFIRVRFNSTNGLTGAWSDTITFRTTSNFSYIEKPTIVSPINNANNLDPYSVTFVGSEPAFSNMENSFARSYWQISTDDTFSGNVSLLSSDPGEYEYTTTLTSNSTFYVRTCYASEHSNVPNSSWSDPIKVTVSNLVSDASGRKFYRHSSGMGTVMVWKDKSDLQHKTLVLDATYRNKLTWADPSDYDFDVDGLVNYNVSPTYYLHDGTTSSPAANISYQATTAASFYGSSKTDAQINAYIRYLEDVNSSKHNTDCIMQYSQCNTTSYAAGWCKSKLVNGIGCDLPNIQTLTRIYCSMFKLDELDPTPNGNKRLFTIPRSGCTFNWYFDNSSNPAVWSSTGCGSSIVWAVGLFGNVAYPTKTYESGVVPILDIR